MNNIATPGYISHRTSTSAAQYGASTVSQTLVRCSSIRNFLPFPVIYNLFFIFLFSQRLQTFTRFVEVGRVVLINYGENKGKICTVIDVVDAKRVSHVIIDSTDESKQSGLIDNGSYG